MIKRIYWTIIVIICFVSIAIIGNQIVIYQYKLSSDRLLREYHEVDALQDFKVSLIQFQNHFLETQNRNEDLHEHDTLYLKIKTMKGRCEKYVTKTHLHKQWDYIQSEYKKITSPLEIDTKLVNYQALKSPVQNILSYLDIMIGETHEEIIETEKRNKYIQKHGSYTLLFSGILFVLIISFLSFSTAKRISVPVRNFLIAFEKVGSGEKNIRINQKYKDEFGQLANEFNTMFDKLDNTTVSLAYVKNIIDNIFGALFVTDKDGKIQSTNRAAISLLGYQESDLINKQVQILFNKSFEVHEIKESNRKTIKGDSMIEEIKKASEIYTFDGHIIPVMTTCTKLLDKNETGFIVVAHDISEKIQYEKQLEEKNRKNLIDINEAQEMERTRIASDLHDGLGQKLSALSYHLQNISEEIPENEKLLFIQKLVDEAIKETREISHSLIPGVLKDFGLIAGLKDLINEYNNLQGIQLVLNHYDFEERIDPKLEKTLFRICQEALSNIIKHSNAKKAIFQLFYSSDLITLMIEDNGRGFTSDDLRAKEKGIGLLSIKERVNAYNGSFILNSKPKKGTEIIIEIPIKMIEL